MNVPIAALRRSFQQATGLRTYAASMDYEGLFEADLPWAPDHEAQVRFWLKSMEDQGLVLAVAGRRTRMTVLAG